MREGNERVLHRRSSQSRWPRVMRWRPVRAQRSVDRGARRPAIEPRNGLVRGADALGNDGRQHRWRRFREPSADPAGSENPACVRSLHAENREIPGSPASVDDAPPGWFAGWQIGGWRDARGTLRRYALDERPWEVGQAHSTCEGAEQRRDSGRGGAGGKGPARGKCGQQNASRTQSRARRAKCAGSHAPNRGGARFDAITQARSPVR
jgi:hypothetical protein